MNREYALGVAAVVVAVAALTTLALSGAIAAPETETGASVERGHASLQEVTIAADEVSGETVTLEVDTFLEHRGDPVENVTVVHRVTDTDTGLVTATAEQPIGRLAGENETAVPATIGVPRAGQHRIETFVLVDGTRRESTTHRVSGLESLTPAYADTGLEFHRFGDDGSLAGVPAIEYSVKSTNGETATLEVTSYLTNAGDGETDSLEVELKARQAGSNIVADAERVSVSNVDPGETATPTAELEVPDEYRYNLDAILWLDGTIVATDRAGADLRPNSTAGDSPDSELETGDFDEEPSIEQTDDSSSDGMADAGGADDGGGTDGAEDSADGTPGFGSLAAALALGATVAPLFARTRDHN
ncbi:DUF7490 domain-containing protein [Halopiger xanaduensis]|uniref:DUF7490 domain-containing protein n=1 Tax=Halopiger xanaduensis (strain DSM 18323 / JCM 14033 / SH-6) TaxID=797210 RepID=F8D6K5_HALXS|nr:hypothetical protein [Halopiger xanaduensis]AEH36601.1 hypothetical protein Halxa_1976 [Halopiger xanaduensis SH-6]